MIVDTHCHLYPERWRSEGRMPSDMFEVDKLIDEIGAAVEMPSFLAGESSPVLCGAALPNFGVRRLLDAMCALAPAPSGLGLPRTGPAEDDKSPCTPGNAPAK